MHAPIGNYYVFNMLAVYAEGKEFSVKWTGVEGQSLVALLEKSKKKVLRGILSKDGGMWLAAIPKSFVREELFSLPAEVETGEERRWRDQYGTVLAAVQVNSSGPFVKL